MPIVRRQPTQERSAGTVQAIIEAASNLLVTLPLDQITTTRIACEAGLSVGALYRFFPDKQSILDAIAEHHLANLQEQFERALARLITTDGPKFLSKVLDIYIDFLDSNPAFRTLALGRHISPLARLRQATPQSGPATIVRDFMLRRLGMKNSSDIDLRLCLAIEAGEHLISFAYNQPTAPQRTQILSETKTLLSTYLFH